jgi:hypothetical protein
MLGSKLYAANIQIVDNGKLIPDESVIIGIAKSSPKGILLCKQNNIIFAAHSFKSGKFRVQAQIMLDKLNGTEAAFLYDNNKLFFDCRKSNFCPIKNALGFWGRELIGEGIDGYYGIKALAPAKKYIKPKVFFTFKVDCDSKNLKFYINDSLIGQAEYKTKKTHSFGFTAHNGQMIIRQFNVTGIPAGNTKICTPAWARGVRMYQPVIERPLRIDQDQHLLLKIEHRTTPGVYHAELSPAKGGDKVKFNLKLSRITSRTPRQGKSIAYLGRFYISAKIPASMLQKGFKLDKSSFNAKPFVLSLSKNGKTTILRQTLILYNPESTNNFPNCTVKKYNTVPSIVINGTPLGTIPARLSRFARAPRFSGVSVKDFGKVGINVNILTVRPSQFYRNGKFDITAICKYIDTNIARTVASAPDALIWLDWQLYMAKEWCDKYPAEMIGLENGLKWLKHSPGQILQPSYASQVWRKDAGNILRDTILYLKSSQWADRIIMLRTSYGNAGEWNHWGYKSKQFVDFSIPMQKAFGKWLKRKYKTVENLRKAWNNPQISFTSKSLVPNSKQRMAESDSILYRTGAKSRPATDYYIFFQQYTVETIEYFAKIVKATSDNKMLSGAYYGYYLGHINNTPYHLQDSGHYGLRFYLRSKYLDFLGGPYPYYKRKNRLQINGIFSSIALHNKVWFSENDQRTHLSCKKIHTRYGATANVQESIAIAKRDYMVNFSKATSYYFFDFIKDWFITPDFMKAVKQIKRLDNIVFKNGGRPSRAQVAVLFSEQSVSYYANHPASRNSSLRGFLCALRNMFETQMDRTGIPWDLYTVDDMDKIDFSKYKMVIFANANYVTDNTIKLTQKLLFDKGKTVLFIGQSGVVTDKDRLDYARCSKFTGIKVRPADKSRRFHRIASATDLQLNVDLKKIPFPKEYWIIDSLPVRMTIKDPKANALAWFDSTKDIAVAEKKVSAGRSILFSAMAPPEASLLTAMFKYAGVHIYYNQQKSQDSFYCAGNLVAVYSRTGGAKKIILPQKVEILMDVFSGKILGRNSKEVTFTLPHNTPATKIIFAGPKKIAANYKKLSSTQ